MVSGKAKTFYLPAGSEKLWDRYLELCDSKLGTSASKRISKLWLDDLAVLEGKETSALSFDIEQKIALRIAIEKKEKDIRAILEKATVQPNSSKTVFEALCGLAVRLGTDRCLERDLPLVRKKIAEYQPTPIDHFSRTQRNYFVIYIDFVLKRRALDSEIESYLLCNSNTEAIDIPVPNP